MEYDISVQNVISTAFENRKDVFVRAIPRDITDMFCDNVKTAVFLPSAFFSQVHSVFSDSRRVPDIFPDFTSDTIFCDIRFMADIKFRNYLYESNVRRFAVIFAECADIYEYGFRETFSYIGEYREGVSRYCQTVAFFSPSYSSFEYISQLFCCNDAVVLGRDFQQDFGCFEATSSSAKFYHTAAYIEKYAFDRSVVYFNTRAEAKDFCSFLWKRGTKFSYADGEKPLSDRKTDLLNFINGRQNILVATKSYIPTGLFYPADRVIFCGVPFSPSHLYRCGMSGVRKAPDTVIYCKDDIIRNEKIISSYSRLFNDEELLHKRLEGLCYMKNMLKSKV